MLQFLSRDMRVKRKAIKILKEISCADAGYKNGHLISSGAVSDLTIKDKNINFVFDIDRLNIDLSRGKEIAKLCEQQLKKELNEIEKVNIVLTSVAKNNGSATPHVTESQLDKSPDNKHLIAKKIIAIASAKGGVGKSTIAANIACALDRIGYKVALVDADIYGPSIPYLMNINEMPQTKDGKIIPPISYNIKCMSIGAIIAEDRAGVWRGPMVTKILHQLFHSTNWQFDGNQVDMMIVDMPPGTGDVYLTMAEKYPLSGVVVVSTPQSLSTIDVTRSIDCFKKLQIPIIGLIQNMSYLLINDKKNFIFGQDGAKKLADKEGINFLGDIPISEEISAAAESRIPVVVAQPSSQQAMLFGRIAEMIA